MIKTGLVFFATVFFFNVQSMAYTENQAWQAFKTNFIRPDGSVNDIYNGSRSHSEGQGYGMLFAVWNDEPILFEKIKNWTDAYLGKGLKPWMAEPSDNGTYKITDMNTATDGDILINWALLLAAKKWNNKAYLTEALSNLQQIKEKEIKDYLIIPGINNFVFGSQIVVNPSYFVFPALDEFMKNDDIVFWGRVYQRSLIFLKKSSQSVFMLPPDWIISYGNTFRPYRIKPFRFGYDAIRVPLYLSMSKEREPLEKMNLFLEYVDVENRVPEYVDFDPFSIALSNGSGGFYAVFAKTAHDVGKTELSRRLWEKAKEKIKNEKMDYYSNALYILAVHN